MKNNDKSLQFQVKLPAFRLADSKIEGDFTVWDYSDVIKLLRADNRNDFEIVSIDNTDIKGLDWVAHLKDLDDESLAFVLEELDTLRDEDMLAFQAALMHGETLYDCLDVFSNCAHYTIYEDCYSLEDVVRFQLHYQEDVEEWLLDYIDMPKYIEENIELEESEGTHYQQVEEGIWVCYWN